jgi:hypothetical protein
MDTIASFGYWLQRRRKALDLTQEQLAQRVGCAPGTIRKIEADERRPSEQLGERHRQRPRAPALHGSRHPGEHARSALARADDLVWLFTEGDGPHQYLVPGGVDQVWLDAVSAARGLPARLSRRR